MGDLAAGYLAWWRWVHFLFGLRKLKSVANDLPYTQRWRWAYEGVAMLKLAKPLTTLGKSPYCIHRKAIVSSYDSPYILLPSASTFFGLRKDRCSIVSARGRSSTSQPECAAAYQ